MDGFEDCGAREITRAVYGSNNGMVGREGPGWFGLCS